MSDQFQLQQHYIILMLTISLLYAAVIHPRECHQIAYGLAYLFIFPAMHLLLPIYSVANIIDQSWGTRDSVSACPRKGFPYGSFLVSSSWCEHHGLP